MSRNLISWLQRTRGLGCLATLILVMASAASSVRGQNDPTCVWVRTNLSCPPGFPSPSPRDQHAMAFAGNPAVQGGVTVLFGGRVDGGVPGGIPDGETWHWNGTCWSPISFPAGCGCGINGFQPCPRYNHAMAYDSVRRKVVLFGGTDGTTLVGDTWEYDPFAQPPSWQCMMPLGGPSPRQGHAIVYDSDVGLVVLFGGADDAVTLKDDTWVWDGTSWQELNCTVRPPRRTEHAMTFDASQGKTVLFGGTGLTSALNDTWLLDINIVGPVYSCEWTEVCNIAPPTSLPEPRHGHAMAYDSNRGRSVLFSGYRALIDAVMGDTWTLTFSGGNCQWTEELSFPSRSPLARQDHAMVFDNERDAVVLFGGNLFWRSPPELSDETWELVCGPTITMQPISRIVRPREDATFTVTVTDVYEEITWSWRKNGQPLANNPPKITGADTNTLTIHDCTPEDNGAYYVHLIYQQDLPPVISNPAALSVVPAPGDVNADGLVNGDDIQWFVSALMTP